jgi:Fe-S-cluster-containing dehydrogenase component
MLACPYQMRYLHPQKRIADKCHWCLHRVKVGLEPACVMACPTEALVFGNLKDKESEVTRLISNNDVKVLKPRMGTDPQVFYIGGNKNLSEIVRSPYR